MVKRIRVPYFPEGFIFVTPIALLLSTYFYYFHHFAPAIVLSSIGIFTGILTKSMFYVTVFDLIDMFYEDYLSILGVRFNIKKSALTKIDRIIVIPAHHEHVVRFPGAQPRLVSWREFTGILVYDNGRLELMTM